MKAAITRRLDKLEASADVDEAPRYVAVSSADELQALELSRPTKVYKGISPDDWDIDDESET